MFAHRLTDDTELRLIEPRHADELYSLIDRNRERLRPWMPFVDYATSVDREREFAKKSLHQFADGRGFECGLWYRRALSGGVGVFPINQRNHSAQLGYWLDAGVEGKGLVTAACKAIIDYLFRAMDVNRIVIRAIPANTRSKAVANRLGFTYEGTHRQSEVLHGECVDVEHFSLLKEEWREHPVAGNQAFFTHELDNESDLELLEPRHAEEVFALVDGNREHLRRWLPWVDETKSPDDTLAFIKQQLHQFAESGTMVVGIRHCGTLAGTMGLHSVGAKCKDIGYWLGEEHQGRGLITKACKSLISHAFTELGLNRIGIRAEPENCRSRAVPERLGFTCEGTSRQITTNVGGKLVDLVVYSLLKDEWEAQSCEH